MIDTESKEGRKRTKKERPDREALMQCAALYFENGMSLTKQKIHLLNYLFIVRDEEE